MSLHPTLSSMGITSINQITRYTLHSEGAEDILKIYYSRPEGSPLPRTKKFQFRGESVLLQAVSELNSLTSNTQNTEHSRQQLATELDQLQQVMLAKMNELKRQLESWR